MPGFPHTLSQGLVNQRQTGPSHNLPHGSAGSKSPWSAVRRKEKRENLSLGSCHHWLAHTQICSLNLHCWCGASTQAVTLKWYDMKSVVRKWKMGHREVGGRAAKTDSLCARLQAHGSAPSASHKHPSIHLLTSAPVALPCKHLCGPWGGMAQVQILTLPLTSWVTLDKSVCPFPHLKNGDNYKTSLWFIVRLR